MVPHGVCPSGESPAGEEVGGEVEYGLHRRSRRWLDQTQKLGKQRQLASAVRCPVRGSRGRWPVCVLLASLASVGAVRHVRVGDGMQLALGMGGIVGEAYFGGKVVSYRR